MKKRINMFGPYVSKKSSGEVEKILRSGWIGQGKVVEKFENRISEFVGANYCVCVGNASFAIRLALEAIGVGPGDQVITTPMTCTSTNHPILESGADIVFADVDPITGNIDPCDVEKKITQSTKAIVCAHWGGMPCDLDGINRVAKNNGIMVIEDASESLGAEYKKIRIGSVSDFTVFSFQAIQLVTSVEGGSVCVKNYEDAELIRKLSWYGIDRKNRVKNNVGYYDIDIDTVGFGYHMTDVLASIGLSNFDDIESRLRHRKSLADVYKKRLGGVNGVSLIPDDKNIVSSNHFYTVHVKNKTQFCEHLANNDIFVSVVHDRNDLYAAFNKTRCILNLCGLNKFYETYICLPINDNIDEKDVNYICDIIERGW